MMNFNQLIFKTKRTLSKHSPEILTTTGIISMITGTILAVKNTPKALEHIKEEDIPKDVAKKERAVRTVKAAWKDYIPAAICEVGGVLLIVGSSRTYVKRYSNLSNALLVSETAYRNLQDKLEEKLTKKQVNDIRDSLAEDKVKEDPPENNPIIVTDNGNHLFYDTNTGQYFRSSFEAVHKATNDINATINREYYVQNNALAVAWGENPCKALEKMFWSTGDQVDVRETTCTINGQDVTALEYNLGRTEY